MGLTHRLKRLEREHAPVEGACSICGWPGTLIIAVVTTFHNDPLPRCSRCKRVLNEQGRPLPNRFKRIIRTPRPCAA